MWSITSIVSVYHNNACDTSHPDGLCTATRTYYQDSDSDGYGDDLVTTTAGCPPSGYVLNGGDCNDTNPLINPGESEVCDGLDNDCSGVIDDGLTTYTYYADADTDNYGDPTNSYETCYSTPTSGYVIDNTDCDDDTSDDRPMGVTCPTDPVLCTNDCPIDNTASCAICINPGHTIECCGDGIDNNCNGQVDSSDISGCIELGFDITDDLIDEDSDGYLLFMDCNDLNPNIHPDADEECDGIDQDCDSQIDEDFDSDNDTYTTCGYSTIDGTFTGVDCDDHNPNIHPGAHEILNRRDDNCDGRIDEGLKLIKIPIKPWVPVVKPMPKHKTISIISQIPFKQTQIKINNSN